MGRRCSPFRACVCLRVLGPSCSLEPAFWLGIVLHVEQRGARALPVATQRRQENCRPVHDDDDEWPRVC